MLNMGEYMKKRRRKRRLQLIELAGGKCEICGSKDHLEFDHIKGYTKSFPLSGCYLDRSWEEVLKEFYKCVLLCRKHHLEKSLRERDFVRGRKNLTVPLPVYK